jgi:hypothetical protein
MNVEWDDAGGVEVITYKPGDGERELDAGAKG